MDTKRTVHEIEDALVEYSGGYRQNVCVPNVMFNYEADLIVLNRSGYATEYEIKRSYEDFKADFKKRYNHNHLSIYKFAYVVPLSIIDKCLAFAKEQGKDPCILAYDEDLRFTMHGGIIYRKGARKMYLEEQFHLARLGTMRYWKLRKQKDNGY